MPNSKMQHKLHQEEGNQGNQMLQTRRCTAAQRMCCIAPLPQAHPKCPAAAGVLACFLPAAPAITTVGARMYALVLHHHTTNTLPTFG
jgi:hypothetical protein